MKYRNLRYRKAVVKFHQCSGAALVLTIGCRNFTHIKSAGLWHDMMIIKMKIMSGICDIIEDINGMIEYYCWSY